MDAEYQRLLSTPRRGRIIEQMSPLLEAFVAEHQLSAPKIALYSPLAECSPKECFVNVEKQVKRMGGSALTGWMFWEIEHTIIYTEAHSIWVGNTGMWVDITPHRLPPRKVMFLEDPRVAAKRGYTTGFESALTNNPKELALNRYIRALSRLRDEHFPGIGKEMIIPMEKARQAAKDSQLPEDVAKAVFSKIYPGK